MIHLGFVLKKFKAYLCILNLDHFNELRFLLFFYKRMVRDYITIILVITMYVR